MIGRALRQLVAEVADLGVHAAGSQADLADLPGVLIYPRVVSFDRLDTVTATADLDVYLVASGVPGPDALDQLDDLAAVVVPALGLGELRAVTLAMPNLAGGQADPFPAYQATLTIQIQEDPE